MNPRTIALVVSAILLCAVGCEFQGPYTRGGGGGSGTAGNPSVFNGTPAVGVACDVNADSDQCASGGLACMPVLVDGGFVCQVPGEFYNCDSSVGCASGLGCHYGICLESCSTSDDCWDPLTTCAPYGNAGNQCLLNECEGDNGFGLWQACGASTPTAGDGTCVPLDANAGPSGCQQGGSVAQGGACQLNRGPGGPGFCVPGLLCMLDSAGANEGICLPACDAFESGGPACATGTSCVPTALALQPAAVSALEYYSLSGACAQSCTVEDGGTAGDAGVESDGGTFDGGVADGGTFEDGGCPAPTTCQNGAFTGSPDFVCLP